MEQIEIWLPVIGYEGLYEVSNYGRVKSLLKRVKMPIHGHMKIMPEKQMTLTKTHKGYIMIGLSTQDKIKKKEMVHRLVGKAFIPNPENKPEVNHINGIKHDNRLENLEWHTPKENQQHSVRTGLHVRKLQESDVLYIRREYTPGKGGCNTNVLAKMFNVEQPTISAIILRKTWTHI